MNKRLPKKAAKKAAPKKAAKKAAAKKAAFTEEDIKKPGTRSAGPKKST
jgi:hypothetical protein